MGEMFSSHQAVEDLKILEGCHEKGSTMMDHLPCMQW